MQHGGGGGAESAGKFLLQYCCIPNSILFDMLKKLIFDLLAPPPGWGLCRQNICYHVAAFKIPYNLIYNMTMF